MPACEKPVYGRAKELLDIHGVSWSLSDSGSSRATPAARIRRMSPSRRGAHLRPRVRVSVYTARPTITFAYPVAQREALSCRTPDPWVKRLQAPLDAQILVISLAKSGERRERLLAKMSRHAGNLSIIEAMEASPQAQVTNTQYTAPALLHGMTLLQVTLCSAAAACS